jgi:hypothetical protein
MSEHATAMRNTRRLLRLAVISIVGVGVVSFAACNDDSSSKKGQSTTTEGAAAPTLPRDTVVPLNVVTQYFPEVTQEASTGPNETVVGKPAGSISVVFTTSDPEQKVTLSVDQYASARDASAAYKKAVEGSEAAPGYTPAPAPNLGQQAFAGTSQVGEQMHFGLGALDGKLIMSATYAGLPVTADNSNNLITLGGLVLDAAKQALGPSGSS